MAVEDSWDGEIILDALFGRRGSQGMVFYIRPAGYINNPTLCAKRKQLKEMVEKYGGILDTSPGGDKHAIQLAFPSSDYDDNEDVFNAEYIEQCVKAKAILNLKDFRLNSTNYKDNIDPTDILEGYKSWDDVERKTSYGRKLPDFGGDAENDHSETKAPGPKRTRTEFSSEEDREILRYIFDNQLTGKLNGYEIWKQVAKAFPHRSYLSLQNRFRRTLLPQVDKLNYLSSYEKSVLKSGVILYPEVANNKVSNAGKLEPTDTKTSEDEPEPAKASEERGKSPESDVSLIEPSPEPPRRKLARRANLNEPVGARSETNSVSSSRESMIEKAASSVSSSNTSSRESSLKLFVPEEVSLSHSATNGGDKERVEDFRSCGSMSSKNSLKISSVSARSDQQVPELLDDEPATLSQPRNGEADSDSSSDATLPANLEYDKNEKQSTVSSFYGGIDVTDHLPDPVNEADVEEVIPTTENAVELEAYEKVMSWKCENPANKVRRDSGSSSSSYEVEVSSSSEDEDSSPAPSSSKRSGTSSERRATYTHQEDKAIVSYIVKTSRFDDVRGVVLWREMENEFKHKRTWQSLKNRFLRTIVPDLAFYRVSRTELELFRRGLHVKRNLGGAKSSSAVKIRPSLELQEPPKRELKQREKTPLKKRALFRNPRVPFPTDVPSTPSDRSDRQSDRESEPPTPSQSPGLSEQLAPSVKQTNQDRDNGSSHSASSQVTAKNPNNQSLETRLQDEPAPGQSDLIVEPERQDHDLPADQAKRSELKKKQRNLLIGHFSSDDDESIPSTRTSKIIALERLTSTPRDKYQSRSESNPSKSQQSSRTARYGSASLAKSRQKASDEENEVSSDERSLTTDIAAITEDVIGTKTNAYLQKFGFMSSTEPAARPVSFTPQPGPSSILISRETPQPTSVQLSSILDTLCSVKACKVVLRRLKPEDVESYSKRRRTEENYQSSLASETGYNLRHRYSGTSQRSVYDDSDSKSARPWLNHTSGSRYNLRQVSRTIYPDSDSGTVELSSSSSSSSSSEEDEDVFYTPSSESPPEPLPPAVPEVKSEVSMVEVRQSNFPHFDSSSDGSVEVINGPVIVTKPIGDNKGQGSWEQAFVIFKASFPSSAKKK